MMWPKKLFQFAGGVLSAGGFMVLSKKAYPVIGNADEILKSTVDSDLPLTTWNENWDGRKGTKPKATRHIFMVRHGQYNTAGNTDNDKSLTLLGKQQAVYTGIRLRELGLDQKISIVYESTKQRAKETSELIHHELNAPIPIKRSDLLRERCPIYPDPPLDFVCSDQTIKKDRQILEHSFSQFMHRADTSENNDTYELFVCHGNLIRFFSHKLLQLPVETFFRCSLRHGSITYFTIKPSGRVSLKYLGDTGHMPANKLTF